MLVKTEELLVGDELGNIYYYSVEWPDAWEVARDGWSGAMTLLAKISIHAQQICGLAFSNDGGMFATGGNDNLCCLFQTRSVLQDTGNNPENAEEMVIDADGVCKTLKPLDSSCGQAHIMNKLSEHHTRCPVYCFMLTPRLDAPCSHHRWPRSNQRTQGWI
jgi:WD40 repeat protein